MSVEGGVRSTRFGALFRLGVETASCALRLGKGAAQRRLSPFESLLESLGLKAAELASGQGDTLRARVGAAAVRAFGEEAKPWFELGWFAAEILPAALKAKPWWEGASPAEPTPTALEAAWRFLDQCRAVAPNDLAPLEEIRGFCEAIAGGWAFETCDLTEYPKLVAEAFALGAEQRAAPSAKRARPRSFETAKLQELLEMVALRYLLGAIASLRKSGGTSALFDGALDGTGHYADSDESESWFIVGWSPAGLVGLAFHKYAGALEVRRSLAKRDPMRLLTNLPEELEPVADTIIDYQDRLFTAGCWVQGSNARGRGHLSRSEHDHDGGEHFRAFAASPEEVLFKKPGWARYFGVSKEQAEVARTLAARAVREGGSVRRAEVTTLLGDIPWARRERLAAALAAIGLKVHRIGK